MIDHEREEATVDGGEIVPFGKYKGQPVETLVADAGYREWLMAQPWFREKFAVTYQMVVNYSGEPAETPEHNELQASFLDDARCIALARQLYQEGVFDGADAVALLRRRHGQWIEALRSHLEPALDPPRIFGRKFEAGGWDVIFTLEAAACFLELRSLPSCLCECNHEHDCPASSTCRGGENEWACQHRHHGDRAAPTFETWEAAPPKERLQLASRISAYAHCDKRCPWSIWERADWLLDDEERWYQLPPRTVRVECKPDLGDDFPAVLRQVTRYDADPLDRRCVVVRRHSFASVTWEQVTEIFAASGIALVSEARIDAADEAAGRSTAA